MRRYESVVIGNGLANQVSNPDVEVDITKPDMVIRRQIAVLKEMTSRLKAAYTGTDITISGTRQHFIELTRLWFNSGMRYIHAYKPVFNIYLSFLALQRTPAAERKAEAAATRPLATATGTSTFPPQRPLNLALSIFNLTNSPPAVHGWHLSA